MADEVIGVIGGSGLYEMEGMTDIKPGDGGHPLRQAQRTSTSPGRWTASTWSSCRATARGTASSRSEVNYRANIYGMKKLGVTRIISVSAVGSLREEIVPGHIVIPDQFIDRTRGSRKDTFFGNGVVGHVQFADPVCADSRPSLRGGPRGGGHGAPRRHLRLHGGAGLLHPRRESTCTAPSAPPSSA